jgi:hypothetical protein
MTSKCMGGDCRPEWNWRRADCPRHGDDAPDSGLRFAADREQRRTELARAREAHRVGGGFSGFAPIREDTDVTEVGKPAAIREDQTRKIVAWLERHEHEGGGVLYGSEFAALIEREFGSGVRS